MSPKSVSERLRVLVVDDEPPARRILLSLLSTESGFEVVGECSNGAEAIRALNQEDVDIAFLDIQMPEIGGFEVLDSVSDERLPWVVFVTAYDEHAIRAFEIGALDYVLKPFDDERFRTTLARVRQRVMSSDKKELRRGIRQLVSKLSRLERLEVAAGEALLSPASERPTRIPVRLGNTLAFVNLAEVDWFEAEDYYVRLHIGDRSHLVRETLTRLESWLDPKKFIRVHRSAIVRLELVRVLKRADLGSYAVLLDDGTEVRVSRTRRAEVMRALGLGH